MSLRGCCDENNGHLQTLLGRLTLSSAALGQKRNELAEVRRKAHHLTETTVAKTPGLSPCDGKTNGNCASTIMSHPVYPRYPEYSAPRAKTLLYKVLSTNRGPGGGAATLSLYQQESTNSYLNMKNSLRAALLVIS